jgi:hypothetical protein
MAEVAEVEVTELVVLEGAALAEPHSQLVHKQVLLAQQVVVEAVAAHLVPIVLLAV